MMNNTKSAYGVNYDFYKDKSGYKVITDYFKSIVTNTSTK